MSSVTRIFVVIRILLTTPACTATAAETFTQNASKVPRRPATVYIALPCGHSHNPPVMRRPCLSVLSMQR
ncbi:hypothetical protein URH17368_1463 [Alicyclobacillus hesperidum URH17-3-68]|nr:hypothetical protein URH17368_1463 [Alicyclobacillus hesperidum URH17-3-68]